MLRIIALGLLVWALPFDSYGQDTSRVEVIVLPEDVLPEEEIQEPQSFVDRTFSVPAKLAPAQPLAALPARPLPENLYRILPSLDTVRKDFIFHQISQPEAIAYLYLADENKYKFEQWIAVKRQKDWLLLNWKLFSLAAPAGLIMRGIDIDGNGTLELLLSLDRTGPETNVSQGCGMGDGGRLFFCKNWPQAKGFCLIDSDKLLILADNVFTGYEYVYEQFEYFKDFKGDGTKNHYEKYFRVWYTFDLKPGTRQLKVTLARCEEGITLDKTLRYFSQQSNASAGASNKVSLQKASTCTPMYQEGWYTLTGGTFVWSGK